MNYLDLFSGIGGFALGAYWAGWRFNNHYFSEVEPYAVELYQKRFPEAIPLGDIRDINLTSNDWLVTGGFPCQPFSTAARGRNDAKKDLWPEMYRVISGWSPRWVIAENVSEKAIHRASESLRGIGYNTLLLRISAASLGAAHNRSRFWMVANTDSNGQSLGKIYEEASRIPSFPRLDKWQKPPRDMGMDDGIPNRMDRLKGLGNAIVPQIAELLFRQIRSIND